MFEDDFSIFDTASPPIIKRVRRRAQVLKNSEEIVYGEGTICVSDIDVSSPLP